jgi:hypothetical protein
VADWHYFWAGSKTGTPTPSTRSVGLIQALAEVLALSQRVEAVLSIHLSIRLAVHLIGSIVVGRFRVVRPPRADRFGQELVQLAHVLQTHRTHQALLKPAQSPGHS